MDSLYTGTLNIFLTIVTSLLAIISLQFGFSNFRRGITKTEHPHTTIWTIRGIRGFIIALAMLCFAIGLFFKTDWLMYFGLVFLAEEILETSIMVLAAKKQVKDF